MSALKVPPSTSINYSQLSNMVDSISNQLLSVVSNEHIATQPILLAVNLDEHVIAAILAIWKIGGFFLPLSESMLNRLSWITESDSQNSVKYSAVITNIIEIYNNLKKRDTPVMFLKNNYDQNYETNSVVIKENYPRSEYAYMMMTSGSTGQPKRCFITHKSLLKIVNAWNIEFELDKFTHNVLQWAPISFDVFIGDFSKALLCSPGCLVLCDEKLRLDTSYVLKLIVEYKITLLEVTPQFASLLADESESDDFKTIKMFIIGSDILSYNLYEKVLDKLNGQNQRLINSYGMTESTIDSCYFEGENLFKSLTIPIGRPLPGVKMEILNINGKRSPIGTLGELIIYGGVVADGDVKVCHLKRKNKTERALLTGKYKILRKF